MKDFGLIIVDKPVGPTSHRIVQMVREGTGIRKVGHAGTLDPRASGVLVLCLGAATRLSEYLSTSSKRYEALIRFGSSTQTYDSNGSVTRSTGKAPSRKEIEDTLEQFVGEIDQVPPPYSAIKLKGKKAYELAREGEEVELEARQVTIHLLDLLEYRPPDLVVDVECSAGTYIRSLAHDLGEKLGTGAHLAKLRRTKSGPFTLEEAIPMPKLEVGMATGKWEKFVTEAVSALPEFPIIEVDEEGYELVRNGHRIPSEPDAQGLARAVSLEGDLVAILEAVDGSDLWHPRKVFIS
jgi:tRNA pseudouridine55 synthase